MIDEPELEDKPDDTLSELRSAQDDAKRARGTVAPPGSMTA
jgi:hypothetical protein